jgi:hypothetical protein
MNHLTITRVKYVELLDFKREVTIELPPITRKYKNPLSLIDLHTGEIVEISSKEAGCGLEEGELCTVAWYDPDSERERGGCEARIKSIARGEETYKVTLDQGAVVGQEFLLAASPGSYTKNPLVSIDREASVPYAPDIEAIMQSKGTAKNERAVEQLMKLADDVDGSDVDKRHRERIKRAIQDALADHNQTAA